MAKAPYFPWMVRDWLCSRRVLAMSGDAVKAYVYLLTQSWLEIPRATIPSEDKDLAEIARVEFSVWMTLKVQVMQHFLPGKCEEHLGRFYNEKLLEISRKYENKQRFNNKNAKRTRIKHKVNARLDNDIDNANANEIAVIDEIYSLYPSRDVNNENRSTGKCSKNKLHIRKILQNGIDLKSLIINYIKDCTEKKCWLKNFTTFLNQLPETPPEQPQPHPYEKL